VIASVASHPWEDFTAHRMTHPFEQHRRPFRSGVTWTNRSPHHQRGLALPLLRTYLSKTIRKGQPVTGDSSMNLRNFVSSGACSKTSKCPPLHFPTSNNWIPILSEIPSSFVMEEQLTRQSMQRIILVMFAYCPYQGEICGFMIPKIPFWDYACISYQQNFPFSFVSLDRNLYPS